MYISLRYAALLFDWLISLSLSLVNCDNMTQEQSGGSNSGVRVDFFSILPWAGQGEVRQRGSGIFPHCAGGAIRGAERSDSAMRCSLRSSAQSSQS